MVKFITAYNIIYGVYIFCLPREDCIGRNSTALQWCLAKCRHTINNLHSRVVAQQSASQTGAIGPGVRLLAKGNSSNNQAPLGIEHGTLRLPSQYSSQ